ncbi:armadillo repeat-containing protein 3-like [Odontomachus brunneus]|uniref:armadillo repeat-containing protein 3-like n=1 Tax=Odontomachus brunneus TaxID=486640 RepID=UPI0013F1BCA3|nr:armadillo repeat-containing protein 3-like [Odontomachus brunneus]
MQEYFSAILVKLSKDPCGIALLVEYCSNMDFLFEKIQSSDPDVKKNNIEILYNIMQDPVGAYKILKSQQFNFPLLFQHFESSYPEIQQHALIIVATIIGINKNEDVQSLFFKENGVQTLLNFLKNDEWSDLHVEALRILNRAAENPSITNEFINSEGIPLVLNYIENAASSELFTEAFKVIAHITNTSDGRKILHSHKVVGYLIDTLERSIQSDIVEISCHAIGKMTLYNPAAEEFARRKSIGIILDVLKKENLQWSARHTACYALKQLLTSNIRNCDIFLSLHGQDYLLQLVKQSKKQVPIEICIIALEALIVVARHSSLRNSLINFDTIDTICLFLEVKAAFDLFIENTESRDRCSQ